MKLGKGRLTLFLILWDAAQQVGHELLEALEEDSPGGRTLTDGEIIGISQTVTSGVVEALLELRDRKGGAPELELEEDPTPSWFVPLKQDEGQAARQPSWLRRRKRANE